MTLNIRQKQDRKTSKRIEKKSKSKISQRITKFTCSALILILLLVGCMSQKTLSEQFTSLNEARRGFKTVLLPQKRIMEAVEKSPEKIFRTVKYPSPSGDLTAYLSPSLGDNKRHPAIIWITGGDCNSIGDVWSPAPRNNDQTAAALRKANIVMMFPSLRGGNANPGIKEGFLREVDDVIAAAEFLKKQPYVDPNRIFLGGHSTGGTLALLVAESSNRFRGVFSFGPVADVSIYGSDSGFLPFDISNSNEVQLRSPKYWLSSIQSPVWVFEGDKKGNIEDLKTMAKISTNPKIHFIEVKNTDHFGILAPTNEILAKKIIQDTGDVSNIAFSEAEVNKAFTK